MNKKYIIIIAIIAIAAFFIWNENKKKKEDEKKKLSSLKNQLLSLNTGYFTSDEISKIDSSNLDPDLVDNVLELFKKGKELISSGTSVPSDISKLKRSLQ